MERLVFNAPALMGASTIITIVYFLLHFALRQKSHLSKLPALGKPSDPHLHEYLIEGSKKYPDTPYTIPEVPHEANTLILPKKYLDEVKSLPESVLGFNQGIYHRLGGKYTTLGSFGRDHFVMLESVRIDLTRNIARTLQGLQEEADYAIPSCFGECEDWTSIQVYPKVLRIIALLSGRIFVGLPLCRDEDWINATINFTMDVFAAIQPVKKISPLIRPFVAPWVPEVQRINQHRINGARLLEPVLAKRFADMKNPLFKPPADMIQFSIQHSGEKAENALFQSYIQMNNSLVAIHTTSSNIAQVIYNLALYPEYQRPLRQELEDVLAADNGVLVKTSMTKLKKMDSFIKESQRMNPSNAISLMRLASEDITLSDGFRIPAGTFTAFSNLGVNYDPDIFPSPETFDGFRFSKLRQEPGNENRFQFVTTGQDALNFGHGKHACPGRFFASNEIKVVLVGLLLRYDVKFKEGMSRPENVRTRTLIGPNRRAEALFKRRVKVEG